jgi:hypothetical protein
VTPEERSAELIKQWQREGTTWLQQMKFDIQQVIIAAIEEDRASRQCCADEREACARIVSEAGSQYAGEGCNASELFEEAETKIRARPTEKL